MYENQQCIVQLQYIVQLVYLLKKQTYVLIKDTKKPNPIIKEMKV